MLGYIERLILRLILVSDKQIKIYWKQNLNPACEFKRSLENIKFKHHSENISTMLLTFVVCPKKKLQDAID